MTYVVAAARTPTGKYIKGLKPYTATELGAAALKAAVTRARVPPRAVEEVIMGNAISAGLGQNPARLAALEAGFPAQTNAFTVNQVCASGMTAVALAAQRIRLGASLIAAGGMESMSNAPFLTRTFRETKRLRETDLVDAMQHDGLYDARCHASMGALVEGYRRRHPFTRREQDLFALESHRKAAAAAQAGLFRHELVRVGAVTADECPRPDTTLAKLAALAPAFSQHGTLTAGNSSPLADGAAALLVASQPAVRRHRLEPIARILGWSVVSVPPQDFGLAPIGAVRTLLHRLGLRAADFDLIELNEAFALQSLAVIKALRLAPERVNVHGGAIALGHPIGASGARILVTLIHGLRALKKKRGLAALCAGGGSGMAMAVQVV